MSGIRFPFPKPVEQVQELSDTLVAGVIKEPKRSLDFSKLPVPHDPVITNCHTLIDHLLALSEAKLKKSSLPVVHEEYISHDRKICVLDRKNGQSHILDQPNVVTFVPFHNEFLVSFSLDQEYKKGDQERKLPDQPVTVCHASVWDSKTLKQVNKFQLFRDSSQLVKTADPFRLLDIRSLVIFPNKQFIAGIIAYFADEIPDMQIEKRLKKPPHVKSVFLLNITNGKVCFLPDILCVGRPLAAKELTHLSVSPSDELFVSIRNVGIHTYKVKFKENDCDDVLNHTFIPADKLSLRNLQGVIPFYQQGEKVYVIYSSCGELAICDSQYESQLQFNDVRVDDMHRPQRTKEGKLVFQTQRILADKYITHDVVCDPYSLTYTAEENASNYSVILNGFHPARLPIGLISSISDLVKTLQCEMKSIDAEQDPEYKIKSDKIKFLRMVLAREHRTPREAIAKYLPGLLKDYPKAKEGTSSRTVEIINQLEMLAAKAITIEVQQVRVIRQPVAKKESIQMYMWPPAVLPQYGDVLRAATPKLTN